MVKSQNIVAQDIIRREWYEKLAKRLILYESYVPNPKISAVTRKFYAKHDAVDLMQAEQELLDIIYYKQKPLNERVNEPDTLNHNYGWYNTPLIDTNPKDRRFNFPKIRNDNTNHMLKLAQDKSLQRPKFSGIPFKV